jgi:hypothetical protein
MMWWRLAACAGGNSFAGSRFPRECCQRLMLRQNKWVLVADRPLLPFFNARCVARCVFACVGW